MHVEPKHIAAGAVITILLALFLFWQEDADGMDQQAMQMEQGVQDGGPPEQSAKKQTAARYEKIRGMESQVAIEELRNPFSPAHEKRGETVTAPAGKEKPSGKATSSQHQKEPLPQLAPVPQGTEASTAPSDGAAPAVRAAPEEKEPKAVLALRGIVQGGAEPLVILSDGRTSQSLAVGERFLAYEVVEIGRTGVRLSGPEGEIWLAMASFS